MSRLAFVIITVVGCSNLQIAPTDKVVVEKYTRSSAMAARVGKGVAVPIAINTFILVSRDRMVCHVTEREYVAAVIGQPVLCEWTEP